MYVFLKNIVSCTRPPKQNHLFPANLTGCFPGIGCFFTRFHKQQMHWFVTNSSLVRRCTDGECSVCHLRAKVVGCCLIS